MWPDIPEARREHPEGPVGAQKIRSIGKLQ